MAQINSSINYRKRRKEKEYEGYGIIYKITHKVNYKVYIGQTIRSFSERIQEHCSNIKVSYLSNAIKKYKIENFIFEIVEICKSQEELNNREIYWIKFYDSMDKTKGYNLTTGGNNFKLSDDIRKIISDRMKGKGNHRFGIKQSEDTRKKKSVAMRGLSYNNKEYICTETGECFLGKKAIINKYPLTYRTLSRYIYKEKTTKLNLTFIRKGGKLSHK